MAIDPTALREELTKAAYPWSEASLDDGFVDDLFGRANVVVKSLNRDTGIWCEYFPRLWKCACKRLYDEPNGSCPCGTTRKRGQLPFVGYHDACGAVKTPSVRRCPTHGQRAVKLPGLLLPRKSFSIVQFAMMSCTEASTPRVTAVAVP